MAAVEGFVTTVDCAYVFLRVVGMLLLQNKKLRHITLLLLFRLVASDFGE